jgi:hypothetical protein
MEPTISGLRSELSGAVDVQNVYIDQEEGARARYEVEGVPTQVYYDAAGTELGRNRGSATKDEIIQKLRSLRMLPPDWKPPAS